MRFAGTSFVIFVVLAVPVWAWLSRAHRAWWARPEVRAGYVALLALGVASHAAWAIVRGVGASWQRVGWTNAAVSACLLAMLALNLALPLGAMVRWLAGKLWRDPSVARARAAARADSGASRASSPLALALAPARDEAGAAGASRRRFLEMSAAATPIVSLGLSLGGVVDSFRDPEIRRVPLEFGELPPPLVGLRILQLTDLHLGIYRHLDHLERVLDRAVRLRPHLVVLTGDVADDLDLLAPCLRMVEAVRAPLGAFSCLGNHEHYRGLRDVVRAHERSAVDLLRDERRTVRSANLSFRVAGLDDPGRLHGDTSGFYRAAVRRALGRHEDESMFSILLCHRPSGASTGIRRGASLVLAGHTHGAQVGAAGRSAFEPVAPEAYLRGPYLFRRDADGWHDPPGGARRTAGSAGRSHGSADRAPSGSSWLYTSSGFGHWLPFRLGCASEAPLIELRQG